MVAWAGVSVGWLLRLFVWVANLPAGIVLVGMIYCRDFHGIKPPIKRRGHNEYRAANAPWAEPGEVYLPPSELPPGVSSRHYDIANLAEKRAIEFKEFQGGERPVASINNDTKREIAADVLLRDQKGWNIRWVFKGYESLSKGLEKALKDAKIPYELIR
jgi:hypothetical protein